jgi:hypothetical protein
MESNNQNEIRELYILEGRTLIAQLKQIKLELHQAKIYSDIQEQTNKGEKEITDFDLPRRSLGEVFCMESSQKNQESEYRTDRKEDRLATEAMDRLIEILELKTRLEQIEKYISTHEAIKIIVDQRQNYTLYVNKENIGSY